MRFVFFGTPEPAAEILGILHRKGLVPSLIVTNPDRPQGRNLKRTPPPVKEWAIAHSIPYTQPERADDIAGELSDTNSDVFIVVAYGSILSQKILGLPRRGSLNVHYSLLPKYRGASPVESQILADDREVGVSILVLDEKMDHGPIVAQKALQILDFKSEILNKSQIINLKPETKRELRWPPKANELRGDMNEVAGELLSEILPDWVAGKIEAKPQDHGRATYTKKFSKTDCEIDLSADPYRNFLKIQALAAWGPHFFADKNGRRIRVGIKSAEYKDGELAILRVVPQGKKEISYEEFLRGFR